MSLEHGYRGQLDSLWFKKPEDQIKSHAESAGLKVLYLHQYTSWFKKITIYKVVGDLEGVIKFKKLMSVKEI